jgi:hypothetical protein
VVFGKKTTHLSFINTDAQLIICITLEPLYLRSEDGITSCTLRVAAIKAKGSENSGDAKYSQYYPSPIR